MTLFRTIAAAALSFIVGCLPPAIHATDQSDMPPSHAYIFRPSSGGIIPDEEASGHDAEIRADTATWIESEAGSALEIGETDDVIEIPAQVFPGRKGAVRITFRPTLENDATQHLFRVYGRGDGFSLYLQEGAAHFRYYNRASRGRASVSLPAKATPMGEWTTILISWDLDENRQIHLSARDARRTVKVSADWPVEIAENSRVLLGNEHVGGAPFHGAIQSVRFYREPLHALTAAEAEPEDEKKSPAIIAEVERPRVLPYTLFFSRTQPKYDLFSNPLLRRWIDRPLFFDRRTAEGETATSIVTGPSFLKTQETLRNYGLDGFAVLMSAPQQEQAFFEMADILDEAAPEHAVPLVMEISARAHTSEDFEASVNDFCRRAERALRSPHVLRIAGKLLVLSYAMDQGEAEAFGAFRKAVEARVGDHFLFIIDVTVRRPALLREFHEIGGLSEGTLESFREHLRLWLSVSDGLMWAGGAHTNRPDGTLDRDFYRRVLIPVFKGVLAEPAHRGKLLGLDAEVGYVNVMTSRRIGHEELTRRFRDNLQIALEAQPDFVAMPEWDELNENTSICPTLTNSLVTQRLLHAYMKQFPHRPEPPAVEGDDRSIPNVIISTYPEVPLGERVEIELVSLPEAAQKGRLAVELSLKNISGKLLKAFPVVHLERSKISNHLFQIPSEAFAGEDVLIPSLTITTPEGVVTRWEEGLEVIRLNATWGLNHKATKLHLRDLLQPEHVTFDVRPDGDGFHVEAAVTAGEPIASLEIIQGARELAAYDPAGELAPEPGEALIHLYWQAMRNPLGMKGTLRVKNGKLRKFVDWVRPEYKRASYRLTPQRDASGEWEVPFDTDAGVNATNARGGFLLIAQPENAVIVMETNRFTAEFPVRDLVAGGRMARVFPHGVTVEALPLKMLGLIPPPILKNEAAFTARIEPWRTDQPLQLRIVTASGRIYRSRPVIPYPPSVEKARLPVWSESLQQAVSVEVPENRIPEIIPAFHPGRGAVLPTAAGDYFYGLAGGVPFDMGAFAKRYLNTAYPLNAARTSPKWVQEEGGHALYFDGKGNFLYFPEETLPRGSFTLEFEIRPTATRSYVLCSQRGYRAGGLTLNVVKGELTGHYMGRNGRMEALRTGLKLPVNQWATVSVSYDLAQIVVRVNGEEARIPCSTGPNRILNPFIFGGYGNGKSLGYFAGSLRRLRIHHTAEPSTSPTSRTSALFPLETSLINN